MRVGLFFSHWWKKSSIVTILLLWALHFAVSSVYAQSPQSTMSRDFWVRIMLNPPIDNDIPCDNPTVNIITQPLHGMAVSSSESPYIEYTPATGSGGLSDFMCRDSLRISVCCGDLCDTSWVYVRVLPMPDNVVSTGCVANAADSAFDMTVRLACGNGMVNSLSTPMVADMDGDGLPEIVACRNVEGSPYVSNGLLVFDGRTGVLKKDINTPDYYLPGQCNNQRHRR